MPPPPQLARRMNRLADVMADGCPSLTDAAYRLKWPMADAEKLWRRICAGLGRQAR